MAPLKIVATLTAKAIYAKELDAAIKTLADASRKEPGCLSYVVCRDIANPLKTVILEEWKDQEAIDMHNQSLPFTVFVSAIEGKTDSLGIAVLENIY